MGEVMLIYVNMLRSIAVILGIVAAPLMAMEKEAEVSANIAIFYLEDKEWVDKVEEISGKKGAEKLEEREYMIKFLPSRLVLPRHPELIYTKDIFNDDLWRKMESGLGKKTSDVLIGGLKNLKPAELRLLNLHSTPDVNILTEFSTKQLMMVIALLGVYSHSSNDRNRMPEWMQKELKELTANQQPPEWLSTRIKWLETGAKEQASSSFWSRLLSWLSPRAWYIYLKKLLSPRAWHIYLKKFF